MIIWYLFNLIRINPMVGMPKAILTTEMVKLKGITTATRAHYSNSAMAKLKGLTTATRVKHMELAVIPIISSPITPIMVREGTISMFRLVLFDVQFIYWRT